MKKQHKIFVFSRKDKVASSSTMSFVTTGKKYSQKQSFIVPNMEEFVRDVSSLGNIGAIKNRILRLNLLQIMKLCWFNKTKFFKLLKKDFSTAVGLLIQIELLQVAKYQPTMIILSDQVTDLAVALDNEPILRNFNTFISDNFKCNRAVMTNNLPTVAHKLSTWKIGINYFVTPINFYGYEMNPDKSIVEKYLQVVNPDSLIAILPEASPKEISYLDKLNITKALINWF